MKKEYTVVKLGSSAAKNSEMLNKKSAEGWRLVSTSPVTRLATSGELVNDIQAFLERDCKKSSEIINE